MARSFVSRINSKLPGRGKALVKVTLIDESGFTYEYAELEVPMGTARDAVAQLHLHAEAAKTAANVDEARTA